jgi:MEMO1 family protein
MRNPAVAGQFYPGSVSGLKHQLEDLFKDIDKETLPIIGAIVPHAGYIYSGHVAAEVYARLPARTTTFIIIGPNHHGVGSPLAFSKDIWKTPLGEVESDADLADALSGSIIIHDEIAHKHEHSIEVQLPFLQVRFSGFKILPISMGMQDEETAMEVGESIVRAAKKLNRDITVIASSDFTHYEPQEVARKVDIKLIEAILNMDVSEFYRSVYSQNATACGYGPIAATITAALKLGATSGKLLRYATSGDIVKDYRQVVGYGALVFT